MQSKLKPSSPVSDQEMEQAVRTLLLGLGEDPNREGLIDTPKRVVKALKFLTSGYHQSLDDLLNGAVFHENTNEMVLVRDIDLFSSCEHHILPILGRAHVAYIPNGKVIGLSKIARICEMYARRLQVQERLTAQIADALEGLLKPQGCCRRGRSYPHVHGHARRSKARLLDHHQRHARHLRRRLQNSP
jgi:GTP cyclohydrolase I